MKKYFIFLLVIISAEYVVAQQTRRPSFRDFMNKTNDSANGSKKSIAVIPENNTLLLMPLLKKPETKRISPGVYALPQDNMPCIVPDISGYNMPAGWGNVNSDEGIYATPPQRIIPAPDKISLPQQQTTGKK